MTKNLALVIEDDMDLSEIFSRALEMAGFTVESLLDGEAAQERLWGDAIPNLIALDLHLPTVDGTTLLKQINADERFGKTRVILTTADATQAEYLRDDVDIVLIKPILFTQLRDLSRRLKVE